MLDIIQQTLGSRYLMFFNPEMWNSDLVPLQDLQGSIDTVNRAKDEQGGNLARWHWGQNDAARLVWVNWIYQRLTIEPIRKPILAHEHQGRLLVDCGDTRLMALSLLDHPVKVSVIVTCTPKTQDRYHDWVPVRDTADLLAATGFDPSASVLVTATDPGHDHAISWMEIGDRTTSHHLHDESQRLQMMQRFLDQQSPEFRFSREWARSTIPWEDL